jgi:esterase/lipase
MWLDIFNEASQENLIKTSRKIHCPVYFFLGRKDLQTNSTIAENYFEILEAPKKEIVWFERSAHALPTTEPEKMQQVIIERVLE